MNTLIFSIVLYVGIFFCEITAAPFIDDEEVEDMQILQGETAFLKCEFPALGNRCVWTRRSYFDNNLKNIVSSNSIIKENIEIGGGAKATLTDQPQNGVCSLTIKNMQLQAIGKFQCTLSGESTHEIKIYDLTAEMAPYSPYIKYGDRRIDDGKKHPLDLDEDRQVELKCFVDNGIPEATVQWLFSSPLDHPEVKEIVHYKDQRIYVESILKFTVPEGSDTWENTVICIAHHKHYPDKIKVTNATVIFQYEANGPRIMFEDVELNEEKRFQIPYTNMYRPIEMQCIIEAIYPEPTIYWDMVPTQGKLKYETKVSTVDSMKNVISKVTFEINLFETTPERTLVCVSMHKKYHDGVKMVKATVGFPYKTQNVYAYKTDYSGQKNVTTNVYCKADGIPEAKFQWRAKMENSSVFVDKSESANAVISVPSWNQCFARNDINSPNEWIEAATKPIPVNIL